MASPSHNTLAVLGLATGFYISGYTQFLQAHRRKSEIMFPDNRVANLTDCIGVCTLFCVLSTAYLRLKDEPTKLATVAFFAVLGFGIGQMYIPERIILSLANKSALSE